MLYCKSMKMPMVIASPLSKANSSPIANLDEYRCVISALYYATLTCPDIVFHVNKLCQVMHDPLYTHWKAVKCLLRYIVGTLDLCLCFSPSVDFNLRAIPDADWAIYSNDFKSTSGFGITLVIILSCGPLRNNLPSFNLRSSQNTMLC